MKTRTSFQMGHKVNLGRKQTEKVRLKISQKMKGRVISSGMLGKKHKTETKEKMSIIMIGNINSPNGEKNNQWRGDEVKYAGLHHYISRALGKPNRCDFCKTTEDRRYHWANINGLYKRDVKDWVRLCVPCHSAYDRIRKDGGSSVVI